MQAAIITQRAPERGADGPCRLCESQSGCDVGIDNAGLGAAAGAPCDVNGERLSFGRSGAGHGGFDDRRRDNIS